MGIAEESWPLLRRFMGAHAHVYRATGGLVGHRFPGAPPILLLDPSARGLGRCAPRRLP
jgi:hypothetical protein